MNAHIKDTFIHLYTHSNKSYVYLKCHDPVIKVVKFVTNINTVCFYNYILQLILMKTVFFFS